MIKNKKNTITISALMVFLLIFLGAYISKEFLYNQKINQNIITNQKFEPNDKQINQMKKIVSSDYFKFFLYLNKFTTKNLLLESSDYLLKNTNKEKDFFDIAKIKSIFVSNYDKIKNINKTPYNISYIKVSNRNQIEINKFGQIQSSIDITINSQNKWRIKSINTKEWQNVRQWQFVIDISDDFTNYDLMLEKAILMVDSAVLQYQNTQNTFDKQIEDAKLSLEQAQKNFEITQQNTEQNVKQALVNLNNAKFDTGSIANLTLNQSDSSNDIQIQNLVSQYNVQKVQFENFWKDLSYQLDITFGITDANKSMNDYFEIYLSAKNSSLKNQLETKFYNTSTKIKEKKISDDIDEKNIIENLDILSEFYDDIDVLIDTALLSIKSSVSSSSFSQNQIDWLVSKFNWYRWQSNWYRANLVQIMSQANSLLKNTDLWKTISEQQNEITKKNLEKQLEIAKIWYEQTLIQQQDLLFKSEKSLKDARNNLKNLEKTRQIQMEISQSSVKTAKSNYEDILNWYKKLKVYSPKNWVVDRIFVQKWQEVNPWNPLFQIIDPKNIEIIITLNKQDLSYIDVNKDVIIEYWKRKLKWKIKSISAQSDNKLLYNAKIETNIKNTNIWDLVNVKIPINSRKILVPIDSINITKSNIWFLYILKWENDFEPRFVEFGKIRWDKIEILSWIKARDMIITTNMSNFDPNQFKIQK